MAKIIIEVILRKFHHFATNSIIFMEITYLKTILVKSLKVSQITQGSEITQANFQKITQATGGFYHSQPPDLRTKKPVLKS